MSVDGKKTMEEMKSLQLTKWLLTPLGVWPFVATNSTIKEIRLAIILQIFCHSLLVFAVVPSLFHVIQRESNINARIALLGPIGYVVTNILKYWAIILHRGGIKRCIKYMERDWRRTQHQEHRRIMMKNVTTGRYLTILSAGLMYTGGMLYHTLMPFLLTNPIANEQNSSNRPLVYPGCDAVFDPYRSPTYEIIFFAHCLVGFIIYTVTTVSCNLAAGFVTHACGQIQIVVARLEYLVDDNRLGSEKYLNKKIGEIIHYHARVLR